MNRRIQRVNQLLKRELSQSLQKDVEFPEDILVTVIRVDTSPNLRQAKVYISSFPENQRKRVIKILNSKIYEIQQGINKRLKMRPVPQIVFVPDLETGRVGRIDMLLEEIQRNT